jgi:protein-tyrosine-phosphatase
MALGFFERMVDGRAVGYSGGSEPAETVNPAAIEAMREVGIDIASAVPKRWTDDDIKRVDVVITMGCGDECPYFPGTRYEDWPVPDPAGLPVDEVRPIRDEIEARVRDLIDRLGPSTPPA